MLDIILAIVLVVLQIPDITTTNRILAAGGRELNPVVRQLMRLGRFWWAPKMLLAVTASAVFLYEADGYARMLMAGLVAVYVFVVWSNYRQIAKLRRRGVKV